MKSSCRGVIDDSAQSVLSRRTWICGKYPLQDGLQHERVSTLRMGLLYAQKMNKDGSCLLDFALKVQEESIIVPKRSSADGGRNILFPFSASFLSMNETG